MGNQKASFGGRCLNRHLKEVREAGVGTPVERKIQVEGASNHKARGRSLPGEGSWAATAMLHGTISSRGSGSCFSLLPFFFKDCLYLFGERREGREKERCGRNMDRLLIVCTQPGAEPTTQACALTGNPTSHLSLCRTGPSHCATPARARSPFSRLPSYSNPCNNHNPIKWIFL